MHTGYTFAMLHRPTFRIITDTIFSSPKTQLSNQVSSYNFLHAKQKNISIQVAYLLFPEPTVTAPASINKTKRILKTTA